MTETIEGFDLHRKDFDWLFGAVTTAKQRLRDYAEPFARHVLGDQYLDETNTWTGWDVRPVYKGGALIALDFDAIIHDDRGPSTVRSSRITFSQFDPAIYSL